MRNKTVDSRILISIFKRKTKHINKSQIVKVFDDVSNAIKSQLYSKIELLAEEEPAILGFVDFHDWFLLTDIRLFFQTEGTTHSIFLERIKKSEIDRKIILSSVSALKENKLIKITMDNGTFLPVNVCESGTVCLAMLQVFQWIGSKNK